MIKSTPVKYETIVLDGGQYQVPTQVVKEIARLESLCEALKIDAEEKNNRRKEQTVKVADRIIMNLISGENGGVLKYHIDKFDKVDSSGNPIFEFRDKVRYRIMLALEGQTLEGENMLDNGVMRRSIK